MQFSYQIGGGVVIEFPQKPPAEVLSALKANGFRWSPAAVCWRRQRVNGVAGLLDWLQRFGEPRRPDGACWACQSPDGYFRNRGAAAPVLCDACADREQ